MDANLKTMLENVALSLVNPFPSNGSTLPLQVKITIFLNKTRLHWNCFRPCSLVWSCGAMGSVLNLTLNENPTLAPSTDPLATVTGAIWDYQATLPTFETPSCLRCTDLSLSVGAALMTAPLQLHLINMDDVSDRIYIKSLPI